MPEGTGAGALAPGPGQEALLLPGATDRYTVAVATDAEYVIEMGSQDLDRYLELFDADGASIASDDGGGGGLDARIRTRLATGDYVIEAGAVSGSYRISINAR